MPGHALLSTLVLDKVLDVGFWQSLCVDLFLPCYYHSSPSYNGCESPIEKMEVGYDEGVVFASLGGL